MWHGPGSNCDPSPCEAIGACCRFDGTCYERPEHMCRGQWLGEGVSCTPNPCPSGVCVGDANCDALINWHDIDYFVAAMNNNIAAWEAMFLPGAPLCAFTNNDVNRDAMVDWRDIDPLIEVMDTSCPW